MEAWERFLKELEGVFGQEVIDKWVRSLNIVRFDSRNLYLEAKDPFQVLWFEEHIRPRLTSPLLNNNFRPIKIHISSNQSLQTTQKGSKKKTPAPASPSIILDPAPLNPFFTLDNFVIGNKNTLLFRFLSELKSVAKQRVTLFNPIYLWGSHGCGKTHLLTGIAQEFKNEGLNVLYARSETFTEHFVLAIRASEMQAFRKAYRQVDVLLIDDVHLFAKKNATQEEFFHTFNALHTAGKQIILSSNLPTQQLAEIEPRLISRFEWGINLQFFSLDQEELKAVLLQRSQALQFLVSVDVIEFLIDHFSSCHSAQSALEALMLRCHLKGKDPATLDPSTTKELLADLIEGEKKEILTPEKVIQLVSEHYRMREKELLGKSQAKEHSLPRQIAMYLCREKLHLTLAKIGELFQRDHSTVMTSIRLIKKRASEPDKEIANALEELSKKTTSFRS